MGLYFLQGNRAIEDLEPLLESLKDSKARDFTHILLKSAFYHDLALEELSQQALEQVRRVSNQREPLIIDSLVILTEPPSANAPIRPRPDGPFRRNEELTLYMEVLNLLPEKIGSENRYVIRAEIDLYDREKQRSVDHRVLSKPDGDEYRCLQGKKTHFLWKRYRLPMTLKSGDYRLVVEVEDMNSNDVASEALDLELKR